MYKACYLNSESKLVEEEFPSLQAARQRLEEIAGLDLPVKKAVEEPKRMKTRLEEVELMITQAKEEFNKLCTNIDTDVAQKLCDLMNKWKDLHIEYAFLKK